MKKTYLFPVLGVLVLIAVIFAAGCTGTTTTPAQTLGTVEVVEVPAGQQINALALDQIDGFINWQPNVAAATVSGVGKVISYSQDLPRSDGKTWKEHTCCVFGANEDGLKNKEMATVLTGLMLLGNKFVIEHPDEAAVSVANWMYGTTDPTFGSKTVKAIDIIKTSLPTIKFSTEVTDTWKDSTFEFVETQRELGTLVKNLKSTSREETEALLYDFEPYYAAKKIIDEKGNFAAPVSGKITIGSLRSDHD
ncbi:MAG TPA: ABC transporter substrate-binding protein, partial [Methanocorpusculum sp.]|nr:ABC transporter substrate-binding protein [Methanocorpusculum sp.]